ncbi:MAG: LLM class flavin-dependent oxidoreductase [Streptosporangiales bacterium]|nr:LLM class flavin-dependent oxidoreductase [Streptosporangiales bacterium]
MRFLAFHLMPYATPEVGEAVPKSVPESAWVTLSNRLYDPAKGVELYKRYLDELTYAAEVGFDGVSVNEHHQNAYGTMPNPNIIASALVQRIPDKQIAILGNAISIHNPLLIAEQVAMLDVLSGGRVLSGFVRGIGFEYSTFGLNPNDSRERFHEAHDLIVDAWSKPGPFPWYGKHFHFDYVNTWPRPVQQPHPPIWIPSQGSAETVDWTAQHRYVYLQTFTKEDRLVAIAEEFREAARRYGYTAHPEQIGCAMPVYVGETDESAREEYRPHVEYFFNRLLTGPVPMWFPPGYLTDASHQRVTKTKSELFSHNDHTFEEMERDGLVVVGSPDTVVRRLEELFERTGMGTFLPFVQIATMDHRMTMANIRRLGEHVLPRLRDFVPTRYAEERRVPS